MIRIDPEVWERLAQVGPIGDKLAARLALPDITHRLQCALDSDNRRHILIALEPSEEELHDLESRGLTVVTRKLTTQREDTPVRYVDIECRDASGNAALDIIGGELAAALAAKNEEPRKIIKRTLTRWRRFWSCLPSSALSREEFLGLFGELWFLSFWLIPMLGHAEAVTRWRGPFGARHDFEWTSQSIEVKTTTSMRGRIHRINGVDQLSLPENGELLFFSLRLHEEASASNTLPTLIQTIRSSLEADLESVNGFETALARTRYSPAHDEEYSKMRLRTVEEALFAVRDNFPRITSSIFIGGIPPGVETLTYEINLNAFDHIKIASTPEQAFSFLHS